MWRSPLNIMWRSPFKLSGARHIKRYVAASTEMFKFAKGEDQELQFSSASWSYLAAIWIVDS